MKEAEAATRIEALVEGYAELAEKAAEACKTALNRLEVAQDDNMALNALLAIADGRLKQAERALEEIEAIEYPAARDVDNVVQVSALVARARIIARQALSSIRQTGSV